MLVWWWIPPAVWAACEAYHAAVNIAEENYNDSLEENNNKLAKDNDAMNEQDTRRCIEKYYNNKCMRDNCMKEAALENKNRMARQQEKYEKGRDSNPWKKYPRLDSCTFVSKRPNPKWPQPNLI